MLIGILGYPHAKITLENVCFHILRMRARQSCTSSIWTRKFSSSQIIGRKATIFIGYFLCFTRKLGVNLYHEKVLSCTQTPTIGQVFAVDLFADGLYRAVIASKNNAVNRTVFFFFFFVCFMLCTFTRRHFLFLFFSADVTN